MWASGVQNWSLTDEGEWSAGMSEAEQKEYKNLRKISSMKQ
jgi:hypothetical protein